MGVITKKTVKQGRSTTKTYFQLSEPFRADNDKVTEIYEQVIFNLPFSPSMNLPKILAEIRKLIVSDILIADTSSFGAKL